MKQLFFETITYEMSDLLLDPHLDFLSFSNIKYGGGGGKIPRPGYLHPYLVLLTCHSMELLHMKIFHLFVEPDLDF